LFFLPQRPQAPRPNIDGQWVHDMADDDNAHLNGTGNRPRIAAVVAGPSTRLVVTNLHYEITPKDLTVRERSLVP
jgi:THO complex subunit 4